MLLRLFLFLISFLAGPFLGQACMPDSPSELILGWYDGIYRDSIPYYEYQDDGQRVLHSYSGSFVRISGETPLFDDGHFFSRGSKLYYQIDAENDSRAETNFDLARYHYATGSLLLMLAPSVDGSFPEYRHVTRIARLSCNSSGGYEISDTNSSWGPEIWQCGKYHDFPALTERELLGEVEKRLGACDQVVAHRTYSSG